MGRECFFFFLRINIIFIPEFYKSEQMKGKMVGCVMRWTKTRTTSAEADQLTVTRNIQTGPSSHSHLPNIFSS